MQTPLSRSNSLFTSVRRIAAILGWTRHSTYLLGTLLLVILLVIYLWWPLAEAYLSQADWSGKWWLKIDWLLLGDFTVMTLLIMAGTDLRRDAPILLVGTLGGLVIESWGTQTSLWTYYTFERPPLWIIPAWPVATLAIDRLVRLLQRVVPEKAGEQVFKPLYGLVLGAFYALMLIFVWPTLNKSLTVMALILSGLIIVTSKDYRAATLTFLAGAGLGYFLELWGTTRLCWTYYTLEQPPLFAVLAHGMAALAFWRVGLLLRQISSTFRERMSFLVRHHLNVQREDIG